MSLLEETEQLKSELRRSWKWWGPEMSATEVSEQKIIADKCASLVDKLIDTGSESSIIGEYISFLCLFYFEDNSYAPWVTMKARKSVRCYIDKLKENQTEFDLEQLIIQQLKHTLEALKSANLSNNVNASGYRNTSRLKIKGKLTGNNYTKILDKMEIFKKSHITSLGYLNVLINHSNITKNWSFILPLLLSFLDDTDFMVKREATVSLNKICTLISEGEDSGPQNILVKTQTAPLFKTAIQPLLLALPSLTPESKSVEILPVSYDTMFKLLKLSIIDNLEYYKNMSALLNDTILPSIGKCKDYVLVLSTLLKILEVFIDKCDIFAMVLMKQVIYTLLTVLMDPYIAHAPDIVCDILSLIQHCMDDIITGDHSRYKYDVLGCMGTLRRRIPNDELVNERIDILVDRVND